MYTLTSHCSQLPSLHRHGQPSSSTTCRAVTTLPSPSPSPPPITTTTTTSRSQSHADPATLRSTWTHRAWVAAGSAAIVSTLHHSISLTTDHANIVAPLLASFAGYSLADLFTGIYHWAIDNYGDAGTPVFGGQIDAFQGHHKYPSIITHREPCNNLYALARAVAITVPFLGLAVTAATAGVANAAAPVMHAFVGSCAGFIVLSQQFHAWAHEKSRRLPFAVDRLQRAGLLVSRAEHAAHHRPPYDTNYCIVSGMWNGLLDEYKVFEALEMVVFSRFGVRPRSWAELEMAWREEE